MHQTVTEDFHISGCVYRENLMTDRFLRCQMDNDQYVPIRIVSSFPKVKRLTNDYNLVVKVLRGLFMIIQLC